MDAFVWDQNFVTGLAQVDEQHRTLVDLFNELNSSLFSNGSDTQALLTDTFGRIMDYTRYHFRDEEELMHLERVDERHIAIHHAAHEQFVSQLHSMWERRNTMSQPAETVVGFLTSWLSLHILGVDQLLARQIQLIKSGAAPAEAFETESNAQDNGMKAVLKLVANLYHVLSKQNMELAQANQALETRVAERTEELEAANQRLQNAYLQLEAHSRLDGLLQIANRRYFDQRLKETWSASLRERQPIGLLMIDVDYFKRYNDSYGHQAGDACLKAVAGAVQAAMWRDTDLLARYGGEELVVILPNTNESGASEVAARVVKAVASLAIPHKSSDVAAVVTVSVGVANAIAIDKAGEKQLIEKADAALYAAKKSGRNRWEGQCTPSDRRSDGTPDRS